MHSKVMQYSAVKGEDKHKAGYTETASPGQSIPQAKYDTLQAKYDALCDSHASLTEKFNEAVGVIQTLVGRLGYYDNENAVLVSYRYLACFTVLAAPQLLKCASLIGLTLAGSAPVAGAKEYENLFVGICQARRLDTAQQSGA